jgi:DNA-binding CsgD family transcriptional regulator
LPTPYSRKGVHGSRSSNPAARPSSAQIDATDRQIDRLVYRLYGLTDEEIAIVEEATG